MNKKLFIIPLLLVVGVAYYFLEYSASTFKVYSDPKAGFSIKIPQDWIVDGNKFLSPESVALIGKAPGPISDIDYWVSADAVVKEIPGGIKNLGSKMINNSKFTTYIAVAQCDEHTYKIEHNNLAYRFSTCTEDHLPLLEEMLSTLEFTK